MAKSGAVWGIDIGQCALKALRCRLDEAGTQLIAEAFDFIEYPKILSQPEADPVELVREALALFLSRNDLKGDRVAISVAGQNGLARFIKLPPVESKKIPDIVKYEARQQIPFALEDVVWDYQQMAGGSEEDGFALETEVGLFAMKRDQVFRALKPFSEAGIEVDIVQLAPLALYNFVCFEHLQDLPPPDQFDSSDPPASLVVLSLGTDTTDLVVTNGYRVWQRSVPLGGNHFTKTLTKELKLTFAKAEHLKRNATKAEDPKAVFQAMRPVFNDLVTQIHHSLRFFSSLDRSAKIGRVITLGNVMKLRGLQKYLSQNLGYEVSDSSEFRGLIGPTVMAAPAFKDNLFSFGVCYGLCVQGVGKAKLATNLLPQELLQDRLIRAKKPWAVGAVAALLIGLSISYMGGWWAWSTVRPERFKSEFDKVKTIDAMSTQLDGDYTTKKTEFEKLAFAGQNLSNITDNRDLWAELYKAINVCLPPIQKGKEMAPLEERKLIYIDGINYQHVDSLAAWIELPAVKKGWQIANPELAAKAAATGSDPAAAGSGTTPAAGSATPMSTAPAASGSAAAPAGGAVTTEEAPTSAGSPTGAGYVILIAGHFYTKDDFTGVGFLRSTLVHNLLNEKLVLPSGEGNKTKEFKLSEIGISTPVIFKMSEPQALVRDEGGKSPATSRAVTAPFGANTNRFDFELQFAWVKTPPNMRGPNAKKTPAADAEVAATAGN